MLPRTGICITSVPSWFHFVCKSDSTVEIGKSGLRDKWSLPGEKGRFDGALTSEIVLRVAGLSIGFGFEL